MGGVRSATHGYRDVMQTPPMRVTSHDDLLDDLTHWLDGLTPGDQVKACKILTDTRITSELTARSDALITASVEEPGSSVATVAQELGVSTVMVRRSITRHRRRGEGTHE